MTGPRGEMAPNVGGLGKKVERPKQEPQPRQIKPGIVQGIDGKLSTNLPMPGAPLPAPIIIEIWP